MVDSEYFLMHAPYGKKSRQQILPRFILPPNTCSTPEYWAKNNTADAAQQKVAERGVQHSKIDVFNQSDLSSLRIAPFKGSEQPWADDAVGLLASWP